MWFGGYNWGRKGLARVLVWFRGCDWDLVCGLGAVAGVGRDLARV